MTRKLRIVVFQDQTQSHEHYYLKEKNAACRDCKNSGFFTYLQMFKSRKCTYECLKVLKIVHESASSLLILHKLGVKAVK